MSRLRTRVLELLAGVRPARRAFRVQALEPLALARGSRVVVFGAGSAPLVETLARLVGETGEVVVLMRHPARGRALARHTLRAGLRNVSVRRLEGEDTELPDRRFDRACAVLYLHGLPYAVRSRVLAEMRRLVVPGLSALVIDVRCPRKRGVAEAARKLAFLFPDREGWRTLFHPGGLVSEVRDAGFAIRHRQALGPGGIFDALLLEKLPPPGRDGERGAA